MVHLYAASGRGRGPGTTNSPTSRNGALVDVRKEHGEERAAVSELRASVDAKVLAAVTEALVQVADACTCVHCMLCLGEGE